MELSQVSSPDLLFPGLLLRHMLAFWKPECLICEYAHTGNAMQLHFFSLSSSTEPLPPSTAVTRQGEEAPREKSKAGFFFFSCVAASDAAFFQLS